MIKGSIKNKTKIDCLLIKKTALMIDVIGVTSSANYIVAFIKHHVMLRRCYHGFIRYWNKADDKEVLNTLMP